MKKFYPLVLVLVLLLTGLQSLWANVFYVNDNSTTGDVFTTSVGNDANAGTSAAPFATINFAIGSANPGDTVYVDVGLYNQRVTISKSLVLRGAKFGVDARTRSFASGESILDGTSLGSPYDAIKISNNVTDVVVDGFEIRNYAGSGNNGDGNAVSSYCMSTNKVGANNVSILNNYMHALAYNGILVGSENTNAANTSMVIQYGWLIQYNKISDYTYAGIELTNVINSAVKDNYISAPVSLFNDPGDAGVGIEIASRSRAKPSNIDSVIVSGNSISGSFPSGSRAAINLLSRAYLSTSDASLTAIDVKENSISSALNVRAAVLAVAETRSTGPSLISDLDVLNNTLDGNYAGFVIQDFKNGGTNASHNTVTVSGNYLKNHSTNGLYVSASTAATGISVQYNSFAGNTVADIKNDGTDTVAGTCNWFDSSAYAFIQTRMAGLVNFIPYLTDGSETDPSPGFQPTGSCNGYPIHVNGSSYDNIQDAINNGSGQRIYIGSGTYNGDVDATGTGIDVTLLPGNSPGCVTVNGNLSLNSGDSIIMDINSSTACTGYDQWIYNGTVSLGSATLDISLGYVPSATDSFLIIDNDGTDAVSGTFAQGSKITVGSYTFTIQYNGGDGNDVVLYLAPTVTCPSDTTVGNDNGVCNAVVNGISPVTSGFGTSISYVITGVTNATGSNDASGTSFNKDTSYVKYIVTDAGGNKDSCTFRVVVLDTTAPSFTSPADTILYKNSSCVADTSLASTGDVLNESDNCNAGLQAIYRDSVVAGSCQGSYIVKRIWSLVDSSGNAASEQIQTISVLDSTAPSFTRPNDTTLYKNSSCIADTLVASAGDVTDESDNCSTGLQASYRDSVVAGSCQGAYTVKRIWSLADSCGNVAAEQIQTIVVSDTTRPVITDCKSNATRSTNPGKTYYQIPGRGFDVSATDNCSVADSLTYQFILSGAIDTTGTGTLTGVKLPFGTTTIKWVAFDACGNASDTCMFTVAVDTVTSLIGVGDISVGPSSGQQYSDYVTLSAKVAPWPSNPGDPSLIPSGKIIFYIGTEKMGEAVVADTSNPADEIGEASITVPLLELQSILDYTRYNAGLPTNGSMKPGPKFVTAIFVSDNPVFEGDTTTSTDTLFVTKENAIVRVDNNDGYFSVSPTTYKGIVLFRANVSDTNDLPLGGRGDIRNATIQFLDGSSYPSTPINGSRNVGLIDPNDKTKGQSVLSFEYQLNNSEIASGGKSWLVWAQANNYYTGYDNSDMNVVTLGMPGSEFVTGGGHYIMELSGGTYSGATGKKMNFGFNMKWNKSGKNLQGKINIIYRRVINGQMHIFHIKSNAIGTLAVSSTSFLDADGQTRNYSTATMTSQASLTDITDPYNPIGYGGNNNLRVVAWDNKQTGSAGEWDKVAVELLDGKTSQLLFSSYISGGSTKVRTINGGNVNVRNTNPIIPPACSQPTNLNVTSVTTNSATLNWIGSGGLRDSVQYRIQGSAAAWTSNTVAPGTNQLAVSSLQTGTLYEWRVLTICTDTTKSAWSNGQFSTTINCTDAPTGLMTSAITSSSATLKWTAVSSATGYTVEYRLLGDASWNSATVNVNYYNLSSLNDDTTYEWRVTNICSEGPGANSDTLQFNTPSGCVTGNLLASMITTTSARLHWDAAPSATGYNLRWKDSSSSSSWNDVTLGAVNYYDLSTLNPSTEYWFQVQVICSEGNADWTDTAVFTTLAACGTPTNLQTSSISNTSATLKWTSVAGALSYDVRYRIQNDVWSAPVSVLTNTYNVASLDDDTTYEWSVRSICTAGTGVWSASVTFKTLKTVTCAAPYSLTATTYANKTTALLSWSGTSGSMYTLQYKKITAASWTTVTTAANSYSLNLAKNTTYKWQVTASCLGSTYGPTTGPDFITGVASTVTSTSATGPEITMLESSMMQLQIKAYPNPTSGNFTLSMNGFDEGQVIIRVVDLFGKTLLNTQQYLVRGRGTMPMQLGNSMSGVYIIQVAQKEKVKTLKLVKN